MNPVSQRLLNQQLICPQFNAPHDVVAWMGAMQGQEYRLMRWAVGMRTKKPSARAFEEDYNAGRILIDNKCSVYPYRGIVCRVHGLAWYDEDENKIRLPYCVNKGLNYAKVFDRETGEVILQNPIREKLRIDTILKSDEAEQLELECGEIRPMIKWF